jgi:hypothetical protein
VPVWGLVREKSTKDGADKKWLKAKLRREIGLLGSCSAMRMPSELDGVPQTPYS